MLHQAQDCMKKQIQKSAVLADRIRRRRTENLADWLSMAAAVVAMQ
jgi:hypothetical protein